ncbi:MAG: BrnT family toxin [Chloroflexota bacterium]
MITLIENPEDFTGFEWNQAKSDANLVERGFDFAAASSVFGSYRVERTASYPVAGEERYVTTGEIEGVIITVVWTPRGRNRRIISARLASRAERRDYHDAIRNRNAGS